MSLAVSCPHCHFRVRVPDDAVGRDVRCPNCQQVFRVGGIEPASSVSRRPAGTAPGGDLEDLATGGRKPGSSSALLDFLLFRRMIAPIVIQILFWLGILGCFILAGFEVISGFVGAASEESSSPWVAVLGVFMGLVTITVGPFVVRLYAGLLILSFRIYETLTEIRDRLDRKS